LPEKAAWKALFDYYIFSEQSHAAENIPPAAQGVLAPINDIQARQRRAWLINRFNR